MRPVPAWSAAVAALLMAMAGGARADVHVHALLANLTAQVIDLDPADGIAPAVALAPQARATLDPWQRGYIQLQYLEGEAMQDLSTFEPDPVLSLAVEAAQGSHVRGQLSDRGGADGGLLEIGVDIVADAAGRRYANVQVNGDQLPFVLSPHTELVLAAGGWTSARADDGARERFNHEYDLDVRFVDAFGTVIDGATDTGWNASPRGWDGGPYAYDGAFALGARIANTGADPVSGYIQLRTWAYALNEPQPVPEPGGAAMLAAGVGWLAWRGRRRK